jgi:hypothetical protein
MTPIGRDEIYENLSGFLKGKGIALTNGTYAQGIQKSCRLLTDAINLSQKGLKRAKVEVDKKLDQMRQVVHDKTAPKAQPAAQAQRPPAGKAKAQSSKAKAKPAKRPSSKP